MDINDLLVGEMIDFEKIVYEDDYMIVLKVIKEISTGSRDYVKRVQLVIWKTKKTSIPDLDIRTYNKKNQKYLKGITFNSLEVDELIESVKHYKDEIKGLKSENSQ